MNKYQWGHAASMGYVAWRPLSVACGNFHGILLCSLCHNYFEDLASGDLYISHSSARSSNELQWLDLKIEHLDSSPSIGHI